MVQVLPRSLMSIFFCFLPSMMMASDQPWRLRADAYVSSALQSSPQRIKGVVAALHDAKSSADITRCMKQLDDVRKDATAYTHAIGVKAAIIFCECARERFLHMIRCIDAQIEFCEDRKTHPTSTLFYRIPRKTNYDLQTDINALHERKEKYLQQLGSLAMAADSFPVIGLQDETMAWTRSIIKAVTNDATVQSCSTQDLMKALQLIDEEYGTVQKLTDDSRVSRSREQRFNVAIRSSVFGIIAACTGLGCFGGYWITENANTAKDGAFENLKKVRDSIKQKMKEGVTSLQAKLNPKKENTSAPAVPVNIEAPSVQSTAAPTVTSVPAVVQPLVVDAAIASTTSTVPLTTSQSPFDVLKAGASKFANKVESKLKTLANDVPSNNSPSVAPVPVPASDTSIPTKLGTGVGAGLAKGMLGDQEIREGATKAIDHFNGLALEARSMLAEVAAIKVDDLFETAGNVAESLDKAIDNKILSKVGIACSVSSVVLGLAAAAYYLKRIASKNGRVYTAMKKAILDISHMIAAYDQNNQTMTPQDLGTIMYIGSRLQEYASAVLSAEEVELLASDIAQLQSSRISILNKTKIVQRMYSTYSFLVPSRALII